MNPSWAMGVCDRCGFSYKLIDLKPEYQPDRDNIWKVCSSCFDPPNSLADPEIPETADEITLDDGRPEYNRDFRSLYAWAPAGNIAAIPLATSYRWR